ncbi:RNA polymerase sigma factor [Nonomuraea rubra]
MLVRLVPHEPHLSSCSSRFPPATAPAGRGSGPADGFAVHRRVRGVGERGVRCPLPDDLAARQEGLDDQLTVLAALRRLEPPHREVVELVHFAGLSQQDAAARLRLPLGTVKSRLFRAYRRLADVLDDPGTRRGGAAV